jgi:hypothetical protein
LRLVSNLAWFGRGAVIVLNDLSSESLEIVAEEFKKLTEEENKRTKNTS